MKKWTTVERTSTADGKLLTLEEHDGDYTFRIDGAIIMTTRQHASEEKAAELACAHVKGKDARVLIGGLGFGFTLKAALAAVGRGSRVVVAELLDPVIEWNRKPELPLAAPAMADPRVTVALRDVCEFIRDSPGGFDAIVLDVDNGPAALIAEQNRWLYTVEGLRSMYAALRPKGCVAIWSVNPSAEFVRAMKTVGFRAEAQTVRARPTSGARHTIFLGWAK
jgi:spermidine synthase